MQEICGCLLHDTDIALGSALGINALNSEVLSCFTTTTLSIVSRKVECLSHFPSFFRYIGVSVIITSSFLQLLSYFGFTTKLSSGRQLTSPGCRKAIRGFKLV